jgi:FkbM family methyltransferase
MRAGWGFQWQDDRMDDHLRRQSWFGLKQYVKRFLGLRIPNAVLRGAAGFAPSLRSGRWPAPANLREVTGRVGNATFIMLDPARCENAKELFWGHGRRPFARDRLALDAIAVLAKEADVFLDVGAYTGLFTLAVTAIDRQIKAHAFEIVPGVVKALEANVRRNGFEEQVVVHREGLGPAGTTVRMPSGGGGSALPSFYSTTMTFEEGELIPLRSLDSVAELIPQDARVVMKIDVEGTENAVFESGQVFLHAFRPDILCEVLPGRADGDILDNLLAPAAFRRYLVPDSALVERDRIEPDQRYRDWLFTRRSADELRRLGLVTQ